MALFQVKKAVEKVFSTAFFEALKREEFERSEKFPRGTPEAPQEVSVRN